MYDYNTKNKSFLKVCETLRNKGIKNYDFMLELKNERLLNIDPYDPNLSFYDKVDILRECHDNIWYFLREIVRIPVQGNNNILFPLDLSNCAQAYLTLYRCNSWITKPRMNFSTTSSLVLGNYFNIFLPKDGECIYLCDKSEADVNFLKNKANNMLSILPNYISQTDNFNSKCCKGIKFSTNDQDKIDGGFIYFEDGEHIDDVKTKYENLVNRLGSDMCFTTASTISDTTNANELLNNSIRWFDWFYDLKPDELINIVNCSPTKIIHIFTSYIDLGLGEEYFNKMVRMLLYTNTIRREVLLKRKDEV